MDLLEDLDVMDEQDFIEQNHPNAPVFNERFDPLELSDREFYTRYRFCKNSVENRLVPLLYPDGIRAENNQGQPFSPIQVISTSFSYFVHYQYIVLKKLRGYKLLGSGAVKVI